MKNPTVSIIIPCYNRSEMLRECLGYFIKQTYKDWELIVGDDGSTEDLTFITDMDSRIKYVRQEKKGQSAARNLAMEQASGEYILQFDSDDLPTFNTFLEKSINYLKANPDYDVVYTDHLIGTLDRNKRVRLQKKYTSLKGKKAYEAMIHKQYIPHPGTLWKRNKIPQYDENLESAIDIELFLTAMENGVKFLHLPEILWLYRIGHLRESGTERQNRCCDKILNKRGYGFNEKTRKSYRLK